MESPTLLIASRSIAILALSLLTLALPGTASAQSTEQDVAESRPTYNPPLAIKAYNYTDRAIGRMGIVDAYGSKRVGILSIEPGGAFGPVCCGSFKGEKLILKWDRRGLPGEPDRWAPRPRTATAIIPPYDRKTVKQMILHVYPDEHVEVEMVDKNSFMGNDDRLHITSIVNRLWNTNKDMFDRLGENDADRASRLGYKVSEYVGEAWKKYRMTDFRDLLLYCFWKLNGANFEIHPKVQTLMKNSSKEPGKFADFMLHLPKGFGEELDRIEANQQQNSTKK